MNLKNSYPQIAQIFAEVSNPAASGVEFNPKRLNSKHFRLPF
ncbi:MAG: hypothetical protein WAW10_09860 [Gallionella sp.]